jgi:hypothetical protein
MFGWFSHLVDSWFTSIYLYVWAKFSPILSCNVFYFCDFQMYFWSDFWLHNLISFYLIPSMDLGARTNLIIYLQPWSECMVLTSSISQISPSSPKSRFFSSSQIRREIIEFAKPLYWELVTCVEVTLVSKFHLIWYPIAQESSLGRKGQILVENRVSQRPPTRQCPIWPRQCLTWVLRFQRPPVRQCLILPYNVRSYRIMYDSTGQYLTDSFSPIYCFGRILLTECPFDLILILLAS